MGTTRLWQYRPGFLMTTLILLVRSLWRFFVTGRPLRDDLTEADRTQESVLERMSGPTWHRLALRWAVLGVPALLLAMAFWASIVESVYTQDHETPAAWTQWPWTTIMIIWWAVAMSVLAVYWLVQGVRVLRFRKVTNEFVYPTWQAVCNVLGLQYSRHDARRAVHLPLDFEPSDIDVDEPGGHSWLSYAVGIGWVQDWRVERRLERETREIAQEAEEEVPEPSGVLVAATTAEILAYPVRTEPTAPEPSQPVLDEPVRIFLPPGKCGPVKTQNALLLAVGPVLGMPEPKATWTLRGKRPFVELRPTRLPPPIVRFRDVRRHWEAADLDHPVLGLAAGGRAISIDYRNNSPHVMGSAGSGAGKSVMFKALLCQRMHNGTGLIVLDFKRISHRWAHGLPGVIYAWRMAELHRVACEAGSLLQFRIDNVLPEGDSTEADLAQFPVVDLLVEEINSLTALLKTYWQENRGPQDPVESPAILAIKWLVNMGREYGIHVHIAAQRASANVFGSNGGDIRESFQTRLLAKWTVQAWKMLAGGIPYQRCPPTSAGRGIWARVQDDEVEIVRTPFLTDQEARAWATSGVPSPDNPLGDAGSMIIPGPPALPERVTLRQALERGLPGPPIALDALRKASQRPGFPEPAGAEGVAKVWVLEDLVQWKMALDERKSPISIATPLHRPWIVYQANTLDPQTGQVEIGYIGQTVRGLAMREEEHRGDKPWADLIVGSFQVIWESDSCSQPDLDLAEMEAIHRLRPRYNIEGQMGAAHAIPKWDQISQRHARDRAAGRPIWRPVDVYSGRERSVSHVLDDLD